MRQFLVTFIVAALTTSASAQTLERMTSEVREPEKRSTHDRADHADHADYCEDDEPGFLEAMAGRLFLTAASTPFVVPRAALNDAGGAGFFPKYPYGWHDGSLLFDEDHAGAHSSLLVFQGDYGNDFDALSQAHGRIFGERDTRIGFDSEFFYRREQLRPGTDDLWHGDFNLTYRFAQSEHWQFRAGLGVNWLSDDRDTNFGFNTTYGAEWFPVKPWVVNSSLDWGRIGSTSLLHLRNTIGITRSGWGVYSGHDYLKVADDDIHSWIAGIEYRF